MQIKKLNLTDFTDFAEIQVDATRQNCFAHRQRWTPEEDNDIKKHYPKGGADACKIAALRHSRSGIKRRASTIKAPMYFRAGQRGERK